MTSNEVGKRISDLRRDKKLTQAQLGKLLGISRQSVGKIEKGQKSPGDLIPVMCRKIGVSADYIYFGIANPLADIELLTDLSSEQIEMGFDILKKLAEMINTTNGNEALIKEVMKQQRLSAGG